MSESTLAWSGFRLTAVGKSQLDERPDGLIAIRSEGTYLLESADATALPGWRGLRRLRDGTALLQFVNFVGTAELGGRRIRVESNRLDVDEVNRMLADVVSRLAALVFTHGTPTRFAYARTAPTAKDVLYQAYVLIRHALTSVGPHDLRSAMDRILTRPYRQLVAVTGERRLAEADRLDATTMTALVSAPMERVPASSALFTSPLVRALEGRVPTRVRSTRVVETTNTRENAFVAAVLETAAAVVRAYGQTVAQRNDVGSAEASREAVGLAEVLARWERHPILVSASRHGMPSVESSVLRQRPGYREVTRFFVDLQSQTKWLAQDDAERLLDARDAALIYEYWCFFEVVAAVAAVTGETGQLRYTYTPFSATLSRSNGVVLGDVTVWFNRQYERRSYSVPLRPDISVELADGSLHLFDAKFKHDPAAFDRSLDDEDDDRASARTYRRADLYKMHTYRDALSAKSVWILFPGRGVSIKHFAPIANATSAVEGVGAVPLTPGVQAHKTALKRLVEDILSGAAHSTDLMVGG